MKLKNKNVLVYGLGKSGIAASNLLGKLGANVFLYDDDKLVYKMLKNSNLINYKYSFIFKLDKQVFDYIDLIVINPSVSIYNENIKQAKLQNVKVISELELGFLHKKGKVIAVTGTNGKTTTVKLIEHNFKTANLKATAVGNVGLAFCQNLLDEQKTKIYVTEVSSFQLEATDKFSPNIACILNISEDHLDRHYTIKNYIKQKAKILKNMTKKDSVILNADDNIVKNLQNNVKANTYFFSTKKALQQGVFVRGDNIVFKNNFKEHIIMPVSKVSLKGEHNLSNVLCAVLVSLLQKIKPNIIISALQTFKVDDHRLELVAVKKRVHYYNDSKATNINACLSAVKAFNQPIILMLGGHDKKENFDKLFKQIKNSNIKHITVSADNKEKILNSAKKYKFNNIHIENCFKDSFKKAHSLAKENYVVLLSPAESSFDEFHNYKDRGNTFKNLVGELSD